MYGGLSPQQRWFLLHSLPDFLPSVSFPVKIISCKEWFDVEFHVRSSSRDRSVTFHRLPLRDPERLQLWLITLRLDLSSSVESPPEQAICVMNTFHKRITKMHGRRTEKLKRIYVNWSSSTSNQKGAFSLVATVKISALKRV